MPSKQKYVLKDVLKDVAATQQRRESDSTFPEPPPVLWVVEKKTRSWSGGSTDVDAWLAARAIKQAENVGLDQAHKRGLNPEVADPEGYLASVAETALFEEKARESLACQVADELARIATLQTSRSVPSFRTRQCANEQASMPKAESAWVRLAKAVSLRFKKARPNRSQGRQLAASSGIADEGRRRNDGSSVGPEGQQQVSADDDVGAMSPGRLIYEEDEGASSIPKHPPTIKATAVQKPHEANGKQTEVTAGAASNAIEDSTGVDAWTATQVTAAAASSMASMAPVPKSSRSGRGGGSGREHAVEGGLADPMASELLAAIGCLQKSAEPVDNCTPHAGGLSKIFNRPTLLRYPQHQTVDPEKGTETIMEAIDALRRIQQPRSSLRSRQSPATADPRIQKVMDILDVGRKTATQLLDEIPGWIWIPDWI